MEKVKSTSQDPLVTNRLWSWHSHYTNPAEGENSLSFSGQCFSLVVPVCHHHLQALLKQSWASSLEFLLQDIWQGLENLHSNKF